MITSKNFLSSYIFVVLVCLLGLAGIISLASGAVHIPFLSMSRIFFAPDESEQQFTAILFYIRLPRLITGIGVGAALAVAGCVLQAMFRNPLADPGLLGVSGGGALAAVAIIIFTPQLIASPNLAFDFVLPAAAFLGSFLAIIFTLTINKIPQDRSNNSLILAGIAVNALCTTGIGLLIYLSDDQQLRQLTFWMMGSLSQIEWKLLLPALGLMAMAVCYLCLCGNTLNLLMLGEREAGHLGLNIKRSQLQLLITSSLAVGAAVAISGIIGFIGLMIPHIARLLCGSNHRILLPCASLMGALMAIMADLAARLLVIPSELPIGLVTSALGAPFLLWLLCRRKA